jgi:DNA-directed RNA polymerase specialized sigma24 family protein
MSEPKNPPEDAWRRENFEATHDEIAEELGISRVRAHYEIARAYKSFRRELFKRGIDIEDVI